MKKKKSKKQKTSTPAHVNQIDNMAKEKHRKKKGWTIPGSLADEGLYDQNHKAPPVMSPAYALAARSVKGDEANELACDSASSPAMLTAYGFDERSIFPGFPALASLATRPEIFRPVTEIASDIVRRWISLTATGDDPDGTRQEKISKIEAEFDRLGVRALVMRAVELDGFFGRGHIYIRYRDDLCADTSLPVFPTPQTVPVGSVKELVVVEPIWVLPIQYNSSNPLKSDFYRPSLWSVLSARVHDTRFLTFSARPVADLLKPSYAFCGLSIAQMVKPYVENWLEIREAATQLAKCYATAVFSTDLKTMLNTGSAAELKRRVSLFTSNQNNQGLFIIDKEKEDVDIKSKPLSGLDALQAQAQEHIAAAAGMPMVKFAGLDASGLNATSDGSIKVYHETIAGLQIRYSPQVKTLLDVIQLSLFGEIDPAISFVWNPVEEVTEEQMTAARTQMLASYVSLVQAGILSPEEVREKLAADRDSGFSGLTVDDLPDDGGEDGEDW